MQNLVRLSKVASHHLPFEKSTYYKWHHLGKFPKLFVKIGGALFVDLDAHQEIIEEGRGN